LTRFTCPAHAVPGGTAKFPYRVHSKRAYAAVVVADVVPVDVCVGVWVVVAVVLRVVLRVVVPLDVRLVDLDHVGVVVSDDDAVEVPVLVCVLVGLVDAVVDGEDDGLVLAVTV
jgi:hypothetical protein